MLREVSRSEYYKGFCPDRKCSKRGLVPPGRWSSSTRDQRYISRFLAGRVLSTAALSSSLVVLGFLRRLLRSKPLIILDVVATAVPQSRTDFCHEWCAFSALLCAQGFGRYSAGYWPHAYHLNNTGARLHKQHNGPGDRSSSQQFQCDRAFVP